MIFAINNEEEMKKKHLFIITRGYPVNAEELSFLVQEMDTLRNYYDIRIIAKYTVEERNPSDCEYPYELCRNQFSIEKKLFFLLKTVLDIRVWKEIIILFKKNSMNFQVVRHIVSECFFSKNLEFLLKKCMREIPENEELIFYSYWYDYSLLSLTRLKRPNSKILTRLHGFDLYNERCPWGSQCFKEQLEDKIDRLVFISEYGKKYYRNTFAAEKINEEKLAVNYLGVREQKFVPFCPHESLKLISCSNLIPLKRVDKIIEAISLINDINIQWTHIGDGSNRDMLVEKAQNLLAEKGNIQYCFKGYLESNEVLEFYRTHYFDYFLLLSDTEGLPVSIMEAMSLGIPVIASDVGGVSEIVNSKNGYLVENTEDAEEVANALIRFWNLPEEKIALMREHAYGTWKEKFNARMNAENLVAIIEGMNKE